MADGWIPDDSTGWGTLIGIFFGGGGVFVVAMKMFDKIVDRLLSRAAAREVRKEDAEIRLREELRQDYIRVESRLQSAELRGEELKRKYDQLFQASVAMETENKLLRATQTRMRAYVIYQQEEIRKALNLPDVPLMGVPAWLDDNVPGPTSPNPNIAISPPRDAGKKVME